MTARLSHQSTDPSSHVKSTLKMRPHHFTTTRQLSPSLSASATNVPRLHETSQKVVIMHSLTLGSAQKDVKYERRTAVRCLILKEDKICIIHVEKGNYYKLPGGGVEPEDSDDTVSCQREALEETGCEVIVRPELIAQTTEFRGTLQ
jgi:hypothetical protein